MIQKRIAITGMGSISSLGHKKEDVWLAYKQNASAIKPVAFAGDPSPVASLSETAHVQIERLREETSFEKLDKSTLLAIHATRQAVTQAGWKKNDKESGINISSSRGATELFEKYFEAYSKEDQRLSPLSSPSTTLGNLSSWVAFDQQINGPAISHSITCSSSLHSIANAFAWINSGMCTRFITGGSEAPLTPFTLAQMKALRIYSSHNNDFACSPLMFGKTKNDMVLGEGAASFCLEQAEVCAKNKVLGYVASVGYATELIKHSTSVDPNGEGLYQSMKMALKQAGNPNIDTIIMHAPGTIKGDQSELKAIERLFGDKTPNLFSNKWKIGHTLGASGALSMELAILMLQHKEFIDFPYPTIITNTQKTPKRILVNALGFGGNAVSVLIVKD